MGVGRGFGKLILFGEHAAVYGEPAVGASLPIETTVVVRPARSNGVILDGFDADDAGRFRELLRFARSLDLEVPLPEHFTISIGSSVPRATGLGSSAAFAIALIGALAAEYSGKQPLAEAEHWRSANEIERFFHGTPSGIDTGLALLGGVSAFYPAPPDIPMSKRLPGCPLHLIVGTVRRERSTKDLVSGIRVRMEAGDLGTREGIASLGVVAKESIRVLESGNGTAADVAALATRAHELLSELGLSTPLLDSIIATGVRAGARAGKLSGAGGGGAFYLITDDRESTYACVAELAARIRDDRLPARIHGSFAVRDGSVQNLS